MNAYWGRRRKWDVARELLSTSVDGLCGMEGLEVGLRVYGHGAAFQVQRDCDDTELVVPILKAGNLLIQQGAQKAGHRGPRPLQSLL